MSDWRTLFSAPTDGEGPCISLRILRRHGDDLLVLPRQAGLAAEALTLYAAQTRTARWAKALLHAVLAAGLPVPLTQVELKIALGDPLLAWLQKLTGETTVPEFAILAGNPFARGRRFIILVFQAGRPAFVVKLGVEPEARALVEREASFLNDGTVKVSHLPRLREAKQTNAWSALALDFIEGESPASSDARGMLSVLWSWIDTSRAVSFDTFGTWQQLKVHPGSRSIVERVAGQRVAPTIFHGDFAPWNVRVEKESRDWTVIDWERGEAVGIPGWDWFHWMIHVSVLVHRHTTRESVTFLDRALQTPHFRRYAETARIAGLERTLLASYLIYLHEFIVPPEIKETIAHLRDATVASL